VHVPVTSVGNGAITLKLLEDVNGPFDLVLTDVVMSCLSGVGLLSKMMTRELRKRIPVISKLLILVPMNVICVFTYNSILDYQLKPHYHEGPRFIDLDKYPLNSYVIPLHINIIVTNIELRILWAFWVE
jgi:response regulator of citrate/malate metabolism